MSLEGPPLSRHSDEPNTQKYSEAQPSRCIDAGCIGINIREGARSGAQPCNKRSRNRREGEAMASNQSTRSSLSKSAPVSTEKVNAELAEMVVFVDGRTEAAGILEFAGVLAQEHGSHLTAVFMQPDPAATSPEMFARGKGMLSVIEAHQARLDRKSTRLNSSHSQISYAVFCLKKKKKKTCLKANCEKKTKKSKNL